MGMINKTVEDDGSSKEEEDKIERRTAFYTKVCIELLMMLGQSHIGVNLGKEEDSDDVSGYDFMEMSEDKVGGASFSRLPDNVSDTDSARATYGDNCQWVLQVRGETNPLKRKVDADKNQKESCGMTLRNEKPA